MNAAKTILAGVLLIALTSAALAENAASPAGHWEGKLQIPNREATLTVDLTRTEKGGWIGCLSLPDSQVSNVPLSQISVEGTTLRFKAAMIGDPSFEAKVSSDGATISGTATNPQGEVPFQLKRTGEANVTLPPASTRLPKEFSGAWEGAVEAGGRTREISLKLSATADGIAAATLISRERNLEIPVTAITVKDKQLALDIRGIAAVYRGTLDAKGEITGEWTQAGKPYPLTFKRTTADAKVP
jgi:hypothetical protein